MSPLPELELTLLAEPLTPADSEAKTRREAFAWPTPPFANYPEPTQQTDPLQCEVVGRNGNKSHGRLTFFVPEDMVAHVQVPPARTTFPLRFHQFQSLTLTTLLKPLATPRDDPHAQALTPRGHSHYRIVLIGGEVLEGDTVGHVQSPYGLFLFTPVGDDGNVLRLFVPRDTIEDAEIGPRIGELLIEQARATPQQVEQAVEAQGELRKQKIGDILVNRQVVTPEQLLEALERQAKMPLVRIGEALLSMGMVRQEQLDQALEQQKLDRSVPLGELLVRMKVVTRDDLQDALSRKMGYPLVDLDTFPIESEALRKLAYTVAARLQAVPLLVRDGRLVVALYDPARRRADVEEIEFSSSMKVLPVLAKCRSIDTLLLSAYEKVGLDTGDRNTSTEASMSFDMDVADTGKLVETLEREGKDQQGTESDEPIEQSDNSLVRLINNMIIEAHKDGVSDIHVESYPGREKIRIRFRKDGMMRSYLDLPPNYRSALIARIKIMCDLDISEKRKPQDGKINFSKFSPQHKIELRVATIPTNTGLEDVVMRILASAKPVPLDNLGLSESNLRQLKEAIQRPYGMVLCVGPTGSGKTTTLHSALSYINVPERKIWTAEDPIEITQPGLRQVQVNPKIDWTFARALRAFLRADPDAIMVGEVRDAETAQMAIEASLTGHLVLSTLHTNSAPETVTRLLDMGMDPFNFADSLLGVLAQRLVRRVCPACRVSEPASPELIEELLGDYMHAFGAGEAPVERDAVMAGWAKKHSRDGRLMAHRAPGCAACSDSGFKGRAGLHELMIVSRELRHMIQTGARAEALQKVAMAEGMRTLRQDGIDKVLAGITTIDEVRATSNS
jgi:type II secretory ATPase GspE/PulE/Tfp pilus assembly ATPase PilB-like protein